MQPQFYSYNCMSVIKRSRESKERKKKNRSRGGCADACEWIPHTDENSNVCRSTGGRKAKRKKTSGACSSSVDANVQEEPCESNCDVPVSSSSEVICETEMSVCPPTFDLSKEQLQARVTSPYTLSEPLKRVRMRNCLPAMLCGICDNITDQSIESSCSQKSFCTSCVMQALKKIVLFVATVKQLSQHLLTLHHILCWLLHRITLKYRVTLHPLLLSLDTHSISSLQICTVVAILVCITHTPQARLYLPL